MPGVEPGSPAWEAIGVFCAMGGPEAVRRFLKPYRPKMWPGTKLGVARESLPPALSIPWCPGPAPRHAGGSECHANPIMLGGELQPIHVCTRRSPRTPSFAPLGRPQTGPCPQASPLPKSVPSGDEELAYFDDTASMWTLGDSLTLREGSTDEDPRAWGGKPPAIPQHNFPSYRRSPFDGEWLLCNVAEGHSTWLRSLAIQDAEVLDGNGAKCFLRGNRRRPTLFGGVLKRKGAALVRVGKSGGVQVYLRCQSA